MACAAEEWIARYFSKRALTPRILPLKQEIVGDIGTALWVVMGSLGLVLLIACANVANLSLVRAEARQQELAIRAALGAGWGRIAREMLVESMTLGVLGGALGLGLAYAALRILVAKGPATLPRLHEIGIDPLVLAFAARCVFAVGRALRRHPGREIRGSACRDRAARCRPNVQPGPGASPGAQHAGRGAGGARARAAGQLRPDDSHVSAVAQRAPGIHASRRNPDRAFHDPGGRCEGTRARDADAARDSRQTRRHSRRHVGGVCAAPRRWSRISEPSATRSMPRTRSSRKARFLPSGKSAGSPRDSSRRWARVSWPDAILPGPICMSKRRVAIVSENLAREWWGEPARCARQADSRSGPADPWREIVGVVEDVYDNGVQVKPPEFAYWPALMDRYIWGGENGFAVGGGYVRDPLQPHGHGELAGGGAASDLVRERQAAGVPRQHAEGALRPVHGADVVYARDAGASPAGWRWCSASSGSTA